MSSESAWMLPLNAFRWIEENLPHGSTILEFGSGEGSKLLMDNYDLFSVEHNPEWLRLNDKKCLYAPIKINDKFPGEIGWYDLELIKKSLPSQIDLMIIKATLFPELLKERQRKRIHLLFGEIKALEEIIPM